ncbi:MAG: acyl-CoA dehydrogenase family protein [Myxococcales bacterium]|nr:acyl-CoA dehydrogenase family protein [Myxococcales bacterium]
MSELPLFDLTLTEEQALMRDTVRKFAATEMRVHSRSADEAGRAPEGFYEKSVELGFNMVPIAEDQGGLGAERSPVSNMLIIEDLAYGDMSLALGAVSSLSFINAVIDHGSDAQQQALLPAFTEDGFRPASVALMEPGLRFDPLKPKTRARKVADGYVLDGVKTMVPLGGSAEVMLVVADEQDRGPAAFVVERGQAGLEASDERFMGLRPLQLSKLTLSDVKLPASARLGGPEGSFDLRRLVDLSRIGVAAASLGVGQAILDYVKDYCSERVAFGEPITHRQSVAFMIADIAIELDAMRLMVYRAAARAEQGLDFRREAYLARVQCADKGMKIGTDGVQLLGGHGFIREHMVELWYRNMRAVGILEGCASV